MAELLALCGMLRAVAPCLTNGLPWTVPSLDGALMPFNSFTYVLAFLPAVATVHGLVRSRLGWPWSQIWLLAVSLFFYAYANPSNLPLLLGSVGFNWAIARVMMNQGVDSRRKLLLWIGLIVNIVVLFFFKYLSVLLSAVAFLHGSHVTFQNWVFPLGVSFFTLTQIMYLVDAFPRPPRSPAARMIYQGLPAANSLFDHVTMVTLFPYVVSGPLVKARAIVPQLRKYAMGENPLNLACRGMYLFSIGLAKKVVLADSFAPIVDVGFGTVRDYSTLEAWIFCFAALFHLYFDFSGYSDMAVGAAWMLGIDIPQNFNAPLRARSISEFWQRWHISLSNFITEYLYKPLLRAMPKPTVAASALATVLAMSIAALWHGPAWTFLAWGLSHGIALVANQIWKRRKMKMPNWLGWLLTLLFITSTIVLLQSADLAVAWHMLVRLVPHANVLGIAALRHLLPFSPALIVHPVTIGALVAFLFKTSLQCSKTFLTTFRTALASAILILVSLFFMNSAPARVFVYFAY
jgi:D-alanyl-lipoteichoic acid acyltransferase DltB (MBOAT superfamily)